MKIIITRKIEVDEDADCSGWAEEAEAEAERAAGKWHFVGVYAQAEIHFPYGADKIISRLRTPGLWAIQSHSGEDYFNGVFAEEVETLQGMIEALRAGPVEYEIRPGLTGE